MIIPLLNTSVTDIYVRYSSDCSYLNFFQCVFHFSSCNISLQNYVHPKWNLNDFININSAKKFVSLTCLITLYLTVVPYFSNSRAPV